MKHQFIDEIEIEAIAGSGGAGVVHFHREKYVPFGGPDGGNGGRGGSVIVRATTRRNTLIELQHKRIWKAESGGAGGKQLLSGKDGQDLIIEVPVGTEVFKRGVANDEQLFADLDEDGMECVLARGGQGGKGNDFFKSSTNQAPRHAQPGEEGQRGSFIFSLKLLADVGLVGLPNAGKSTLVSVLSAAKPKIASYPFTTLTPCLGVVQLSGQRSFVVADVPGLIPDAHLGKGLGIQFLKHLERTRVLLHLIDTSDLGSKDEVQQRAAQVERELQLFSTELAQKPIVYVLTKSDIGDRAFQVSSADLGTTHPVFEISAVAGQGIQELKEFLWKVLKSEESFLNTKAALLE